jgi:hypothetical protein
LNFKIWFNQIPEIPKKSLKSFFYLQKFKSLFLEKIKIYKTN